MSVAVIVGARPQFIKAAPFLRALEAAGSGRVVLIHSGQHFDDEMSAAFFRELKLPDPDYHLGVHSGSHGQMTAAMLTGIEDCLTGEQVECAVVFGDTNTTLAGALAAVKLGIPCAHIEAGLRSWNRTMPEEINRVLVDHCSTWLFCPTEHAVRNLLAEGIQHGVELVGDIMLDAVRLFAPEARDRSRILERFELTAGQYYFLTVHRAYNTADASALAQIFTACSRLPGPVLFPVHPRTRRLLTGDIEVPRNVIVSGPLGYLDTLCAVSQASVVLTDSGGLQKEACFLEVPCVTLRPETEWVETVSGGWNVLAGTEAEGIVNAVAEVSRKTRLPITSFGDGFAASRICTILRSGIPDRARIAPGVLA